MKAILLFRKRSTAPQRSVTGDGIPVVAMNEVDRNETRYGSIRNRSVSLAEIRAVKDPAEWFGSLLTPSFQVPAWSLITCTPTHVGTKKALLRQLRAGGFL